METLTTANSMMNLDQSSSACNPESFGLVVRYGSMEYRDQKIEFLSDPMGNQVFAKWGDRLIDLGLNNIYYKEDVCKLVDYELDTIANFCDDPRLTGAKLEWFHNGDYRDIKLGYKGRIIKVFLQKYSKVNLESLIRLSREILYGSGLLESDDETSL